MSPIGALAFRRRLCPYSGQTCKWFHPFMPLEHNKPDALCSPSFSIFAGGSLFVAKVALPHEQSLAGGVFNTVTQIGTSIGLALTSVVLDRTITSKAHSLGADVPAGGAAASNAPKEALLAGYKAAQWFNFAFVMVGLVFVMLFMRGMGIIAKKGGYGRRGEEEGRGEDRYGRDTRLD